VLHQLTFAFIYIKRQAEIRLPPRYKPRDTPKNNNMAGVDLSLAINYVPACFCVCKLILLMLLISFIKAGDEISSYTILAVALYLDRLIGKNMIFDSNAILLAVYFANVYGCIRSNATHKTLPFLMFMVHLSWIISCACALSEPSAFRHWFEKRSRTQRYGPSALMLIMITCMTYFFQAEESVLSRFCRGLVFTLLALGWIYIVGVRNQSGGIEYLKDTSSHFISRLAPVLYSPIWACVLFTFMGIAALVYQYLKINSHEVQDQGYQLVPNQNPDDLGILDSSGSVLVTIPEHREEQAGENLEEIFRKAKMGRMQPTV